MLTGAGQKTSKFKTPITGLAVVKPLFVNPTNEDYKSYFKKIIEYYPMMSKIFDESGNVKTTIMFDNNLTSKNNTGNDENIMSCELSDYILII